MKLPVESARVAGFDAHEIGQPVSGPLESLDSDEPWMGDHFTQENFEQLQDAQEAGEIGPPLDLAKYARFAEGDTAGFEKWLKTQPQDVQDDWAANKEKYGDQFKTASRALPTDFTYTIDMDERGEFRATVYDPRGREVLEIDDSIFEDGFMRHKNDLRGLAEYLEDLGIGAPGSRVRTAAVVKTASKTVDIEKTRDNPGGHSDEDVALVDFRFNKASGDKSKTAALTTQRVRVPVAVSHGEPPIVDGLAYGPLVIHRGLGSGWVLSFAPEQNLNSDRAPAIAIKRDLRSQRDAVDLLEALVGGVPEVLRANTASEVQTLGRKIMDVINGWSPKVGVKPAAPRLVDAHAQVRQWITDTGLPSLGERYGKAGEFFGLKGGARVISLGKRDVLLNTFQVTNYGYRLGESWVLAKSELISKATPELIAKWAQWVKQGPTMIEVRNKARDAGESARRRGLTARYHEGPEGEREFQDDLEAGVYPESFENSWEENTEKYGDQFKTASFALTRADRGVLNAFLDQQSASSEKLDTDGKTLDGLWMGGRGIATWHMGKIEFHDLGSRVAQQIQRVLSSMAPAAWVKKASVNLDMILSTLTKGRMNREDFPDMDDLSLVEAIYCYCADYHEGMGSPEYRCLSELKAGGFRPGPNLSARRLDPEQKYVYEQLGGEI